MDKRKRNDFLLSAITYAASFVSVVVLGAILVFVFSRGLRLFNLDIILGDYNSQVVTLKTEDEVIYTGNPFSAPTLEDHQYFSSRFGIVFEDATSLEGKPVIQISYIDASSPLRNMIDVGESKPSALLVKHQFDTAAFLIDDAGNMIIIFGSDGAQAIAGAFDQAARITSLPVATRGGGIRGSIIATVYLVVLTLLIALPFGVFTALYLHEIAKQNKLTQIMRSFIDMLTGVPSIIYGLMGAALFIPLTQRLFGSGNIEGGTLISGSLTLAVIVLPVVIKATESALDVVPKDYKMASLALGANQTQTTFKVMLPNAIPGILSAALLSIGRVIGESAALIFAVGTAIKDQVSYGDKATSLAVHIWTAMAGESPNLALASTISIMILIVVLTLNLTVKLITSRFMKRYQ